MSKNINFQKLAPEQKQEILNELEDKRKAKGINPKEFLNWLNELKKNKQSVIDDELEKMAEKMSEKIERPEIIKKMMSGEIEMPETIFNELIAYYKNVNIKSDVLSNMNTQSGKNKNEKAKKEAKKEPNTNVKKPDGKGKFPTKIALAGVLFFIGIGKFTFDNAKTQICFLKNPITTEDGVQLQCGDLVMIPPLSIENAHDRILRRDSTEVYVISDDGVIKTKMDKDALAECTKVPCNIENLIEYSVQATDSDGYVTLKDKDGNSYTIPNDYHVLADLSALRENQPISVISSTTGVLENVIVDGGKLIPCETRRAVLGTEIKVQDPESNEIIEVPTTGIEVTIPRTITGKTATQGFRGGSTIGTSEVTGDSIKIDINDIIYTDKDGNDYVAVDDDVAVDNDVAEREG